MYEEIIKYLQKWGKIGGKRKSKVFDVLIFEKKNVLGLREVKSKYK